jgi:hypothetical protein
MSLYIIVRHQRDPDQPWKNDWLDSAKSDPALLDYIFTTPQLAALCDAERRNQNEVFVHRCQFQNSPRIVCCSARVAAVNLVTNPVTFSNHAGINLAPRMRANQGQIHYMWP